MSFLSFALLLDVVKSAIINYAAIDFTPGQYETVWNWSMPLVFIFTGVDITRQGFDIGGPACIVCGAAYIISDIVQTVRAKSLAEYDPYGITVIIIVVAMVLELFWYQRWKRRLSIACCYSNKKTGVADNDAETDQNTGDKQDG